MANAKVGEEVTVAHLRVKTEELTANHETLKESIQDHINEKMLEADVQSATMQSYALKSMATVSGWITSQTFFVIISKLVKIDNANVQNVVSNGIYAVLVTIFVPLLQWTLRGETEEVGKTIFRDQRILFKATLPMFFAWGWKNFIASILTAWGSEFVPELVVTVILTVLVIGAELLPCYSASVAKIKAGGESDTLLCRYAVCPGQIGLAVGYAWNACASWPVGRITRNIESAMFIFMIQVVYYVIISSIIVGLTAKWATRQEAKKSKVSSVEGELERAERDVSETSANVALDAMHFVYAWAQLDTVTDLVFTYLLDCSSPTTCSYQSNFAFSIAATYLFAKLAMMFKTETRQSAWNKASTDLMTQGLSLNCAWAWINYCQTAVANTTANNVDIIPVYLLCSAFCWVFMSMGHRKFQVERRAWDRNFKDKAKKTVKKLDSTKNMDEPSQPSESATSTAAHV